LILQVLFREDATVDDLIDVIEGNRKYIKCVYVYNKIDVVGIDDVDNLALAAKFTCDKLQFKGMFHLCLSSV
jgi:ribosome-interacting GTPase 1